MEHQQGKLIERAANRKLLIFYDVLILAASVLALNLLRPRFLRPVSVKLVLLQACVFGGCLLACRLLLRVYRQVLRYGYLWSYARTFAADLLAGLMYIVLLQVLQALSVLKFRIFYMEVVTFILINLILTFLSRLAYYYIYVWSGRKTRFGDAMRKFLKVFAFIDFDSDEPGAVLHFGMTQEQKSSEPINALLNIARQFAIHGEITSVTQINKGYINRTYRVDTVSEAGHVHMYTLQRINTNVFPDVEALMENFTLVTEHLHSKFLLPGHTDKGSIQMVRITKDGKLFYHDDSGYWRMMSHFDGVYSLDIPDSPQTFYYAGQAFGKFVKEMSDVDIDRVNIVIPNFHNTWSRYLDLEKAIEADPVGRVGEVKEEIEFVRARKSLFSCISDKLETGEIPLRICHNDCNLNNILFDNNTHLPVAVIDLDTVMPSSPLYDFGDSMRIGTNTATDDEKDLSKVSCDMNLYEQYARGYLETCGDMLTQKELELLPYAALVITSEDGIRFLMDHINGDTYYNIFYPGQNLDRARTQLKLLEDMENKLPQIREILKKIYKDLGLTADLAA